MHKQSSSDDSVADKKKDEELFVKAFPEFISEEDEPEEEKEEIFYIFDSIKEIFDIYNITVNFVINEFNSLDSYILVELIKDKNLNLSDSLLNISYIHSGFLSVVNSKEVKNG